MLKKLASLLALVMVAATVHAEKIIVTQVFADVRWNDFGVTTGVGYGKKVTGDWIFKGTLDTSAPNESWYPESAGAYAAKVTLTQGSLGLVDEPILNLPYLGIRARRIGFDAAPFSSAPWTSTDLSFTTFNDFGTLPMAVGDSWKSGFFGESAFGPQWDGFFLGNGLRLHGWGYAASSIVSVAAATPVPEPATYLLFLLGAGVLFATTRIKAGDRFDVLAPWVRSSRPL